jgi:N-acetylglucosaminyldiphosphoundecaprenol N-acetyl-beta-D-mannosaminyltransferase
VKTDKNITKIIFTANAAIISEANTSKRLYDILNNNYVTFDGQIPYIIAKVLKGKNKRYEKLSGSDIIYDFCEFVKMQNYKMFFLGGKIENNKISVDIIEKKYNIVVNGYSPDFENYPFSNNFNNSCLKKINDFKPDVLFVGFGTPKENYWVDDYKMFLSEIGVKYVICCGGTFDFVSKKIKRAPIFIQKLGLEGLYRLFQEPNKIRYNRLVDSFKFFKYIWHKPDFYFKEYE